MCLRFIGFKFCQDKKHKALSNLFPSAPFPRKEDFAFGSRSKWNLYQILVTGCKVTAKMLENSLCIEKEALSLRPLNEFSHYF